MEDRRPRERELVLAPNEFAWVLDTTKGHINCYAGPNKTSLAQTDQLVTFDEVSKRFIHAEIATAVQLFATAPENWYLVLKNPAVDNTHPRLGVASGLIELQVGKKVVVRGPASFALWPGQMARIVEAHRLRTNQFLIARIYDVAIAMKNNAEVLARPIGPDEQISFVVGQTFVIPGDRVAFYMPPDGVEVVADVDGSMVREAVTLRRLEYCVVVGENGRRRTVRGEAVVFPAPDEHFVEVDGRRCFRAIELSETTGLHLKVTAPHVDEDDVAHAEGDELFVTGAATRLYFPREEHAIVRTASGGELHHAVAIPAGDGRYVLDRHTGEVSLVVGPRMFLPDPRHQVLTRRALSDRDVALFYPGNEEALAHNRTLRGVTSTSSMPRVAIVKAPSTTMSSHEGMETFTRQFIKPASLLLDTKYDGAVTIDVWSGYAVCVKDRRGQRRVVVGPQTVMLGFDETLEALSLSTSTPKTTTHLLATTFLRVSGNQVGDVVDVISADLVDARVQLTWRVGFTGEPAQWFVVDNYVKLLCEHASSILKARARKTPIRVLRAEIAELARDAILGERGADGRPGLVFAENGMRIFDVEIHGIEIVDDSVRDLLESTQRAAVASAVDVARREVEVVDGHRLEEITRTLLAEEHATQLLTRRLADELDTQLQRAERLKLEHRAVLQEQQLAAAVALARSEVEVRAIRRTARESDSAVELAELQHRQTLEMELLRASTEARVRQASAVSPELSAALTRLGDTQLLSALAENFGELAAVEGRGLLETARKFLDVMPQGSLPIVRMRDPSSTT